MTADISFGQSLCPRVYPKPIWIKITSVQDLDARCPFQWHIHLSQKFSCFESSTPDSPLPLNLLALESLPLSPCPRAPLHQSSVHLHRTFSCLGIFPNLCLKTSMPYPCPPFPNTQKLQASNAGHVGCLISCPHPTCLLPDLLPNCFLRNSITHGKGSGGSTIDAKVQACWIPIPPTQNPLQKYLLCSLARTQSCVIFACSRPLDPDILFGTFSSGLWLRTFCFGSSALYSLLQDLPHDLELIDTRYQGFPLCLLNLEILASMSPALPPWVCRYSRFPSPICQRRAWCIYCEVMQGLDCEGRKMQDFLNGGTKFHLLVCKQTYLGVPLQLSMTSLE